jgi:hypothetical protein
MEFGGSSPFSQEPATLPYLESNEFSSSFLFPICLRTILILSSHFCPDSHNGLLPPGISARTLYVFLFHVCYMCCLPHSSWLYHNIPVTVLMLRWIWQNRVRRPSWFWTEIHPKSKNLCEKWKAFSLFHKRLYLIEYWGLRNSDSMYRCTRTSSDTSSQAISHVNIKWKSDDLEAMSMFVIRDCCDVRHGLVSRSWTVTSHTNDHVQCCLTWMLLITDQRRLHSAKFTSVGHMNIYIYIYLCVCV